MTAVEREQEQSTDQPDRRLVAGRYRLHARIGRGRIGEIYSADDEEYQDVGVGGSVAVQLLADRVTQNNGLFSKLKLGYAVLRGASHPNIVSYHDIDHDGKYGYLVMDHLDGASLRTILDSAETLPLDEANPVIRAIGHALQFLHAKSIVHGQLTADNVFITEDLEVRLLDVVPLDSASTTLIRVASKDPFSRSDTSDDVYALGCLAYEMLAGKHPFNHLSLTDARIAGLKLTRIHSLHEVQWNALRRALSFDNERRTLTVAEFLTEFGIAGTERLRPVDDAPTKEAAPVVPPPQSAVVSNKAPPVARPGPAIRPLKIQDADRRNRRGANGMPSLVLIAILAGLVAWIGFGQPGTDLIALGDFADAYLGDGTSENDDGIVMLDASESFEMQTVDDDTPVVDPTDENLPVEGTESTAAIESPAPAEADALQIAEIEVDEPAALPSDESLAIATDDVLQPGDAVETSTAANEAISAANEIDATQSSTELTLIQSFVTISERDGAVRINARRPANTAGRVFWWTEDDTAIADQDFIRIDTPVEGFTSGEELESLHIPLINDGIAESVETFYVFLGQYDASLGSLEPVLRVRVDINDDDR